MVIGALSPVPLEFQQSYEYQCWPAWFYGPGGKSAVFQCEEDVPDGWMSYDDYTAGKLAEAEETGVTGEDKERVLTADQRKAALSKLIDGNTQAALAAMLATMQMENHMIEYLPTWPKQRLAEVVVDNGGPHEAEEA